MGNATTIADFKAVSQELVHASLSITDRVYGVLQGEDVQTRIRSLSGGTNAEEQVNEDQAAIIAQIQTLAAKLVM